MFQRRLQSRRPRYSRAAPIAMLVCVAVLLGVPALEGAVQRAWDAAPTRSPDGTVQIRTEFGLCHEGGGTNCVVDGDTVWIAGEKVRIAGIDAPETHEPKCAAEAALGKRSAERLHALLNSGTVTARPADRNRDPNGRLLRTIDVDGRDVGKTLISEGLAREYAGAKHGWCG
jgi:endonuclease YncB( thermonuclease family)